MTLVIPGVEVTVVKDVVPQQLAPSGVLGIVGLTEAASAVTGRASSWSRFRELFGSGTAYSIPEARLALDNGAHELVVAPIQSTSAARAGAVLPRAAATGDAFSLAARAPGTWANGLSVRVRTRKGKDKDGKEVPVAIDLEVDRPGGEPEVFRQLSAVPGESNYLVDALANAGASTVATAAAEIRLKARDKVIVTKDATATLSVLEDAVGGAIASFVAGQPGAELEVTVTPQRITLRKKDQAAGEFAPLGAPIELAGIALPGGESAIVQKLRARLDLQAPDKRFFELDVKAPGWPADGEYKLKDGKDATASEYRDALQALREEPDVDMVVAAVQDFSGIDKVTQIYSDVIAHCATMSEQCKGRVGFGQVAPFSDQDRDIRARVEMASNLVSDRFVLLAPHGVLGAVAGMVGSLPYYYSPTFKRVGGLGKLKTPLKIDEQRELLKGDVVPVAKEPSKGLVVLRGLTTDGDQINVRRVADRAVRGVKMIGDLFIGSLNNENGRNALKQKLSEFLLQMQKEGALVPSTDGSDPAFKVSVYSSQADFALGIVRVDLAVRPVRAIDYIYATILIQT